MRSMIPVGAIVRFYYVIDFRMSYVEGTLEAHPTEGDEMWYIRQTSDGPTKGAIHALNPRCVSLVEIIDVTELELPSDTWEAEEIKPEEVNQTTIDVLDRMFGSDRVQ